MTDPNQFLPNSVEIRTTQMLVDELTAAIEANPLFADQPIGFSSGDDTARFVTGYDECTATGRIVLTSDRRVVDSKRYAEAVLGTANRVSGGEHDRK